MLLSGVGLSFGFKSWLYLSSCDLEQATSSSLSLREVVRETQAGSSSRAVIMR